MIRPGTIGLDIGGANLKLAAGGWAISRPFPLWQNPEGLADALASLAGALPEPVRKSGSRPCLHVFATMTGELCDCFSSREAGVAHIVESVARSFPESTVAWYRLDGRFCDGATARREWRQVAAANWHAIARAAARFLPSGTGLVIDMGSTTTDVVPVVRGRVVARGASDLQRMQCGELLYTGLLRSPVCSLARGVSLGDGTAPLAQEWFATMADVRIVLGEWPESDRCEGMADGRPADRVHALDRLARAVCSDRDELGDQRIEALAADLAGIQEDAILGAIRAQWERFPVCRGATVVAGVGAGVVERVLVRASQPLATDAEECVQKASKVVRLADATSPAISAAAGAWAVAVLASGIAAEDDP